MSCSRAFGRERSVAGGVRRGVCPPGTAHPPRYRVSRSLYVHVAANGPTSLLDPFAGRTHSPPATAETSMGLHTRRNVCFDQQSQSAYRRPVRLSGERTCSHAPQERWHQANGRRQALLSCSKAQPTFRQRLAQECSRRFGSARVGYVPRGTWIKQGCFSMSSYRDVQATRHATAWRGGCRGAGRDIPDPGAASHRRHFGSRGSTQELARARHARLWRCERRRHFCSRGGGRSELARETAELPNLARISSSAESRC